MVSLKSMLASTALLLSLWQQPAGAMPTSPNYDAYLKGFSNQLEQRAEDFYLRIMPLGASITRGQPAPEDTKGNGYRKFIRDQLRSEGWKVNMVGSYSYGEMADNNNEGWPGYTVSQVHDKAKLSLPNMRPNLVLINAGTNDAAKSSGVEGVGRLMEAMVIECFTQNPRTTVIVSTLIPNRDNQPNTDIINGQYRALVSSMQNQGYHVELAEMADGFMTMSDISGDGIHPTLEGFKKMAAVWRHAFGKVLKHDGWLQEPPSDVFFKDDDVSGGRACPKAFASGNSDLRAGEQILTAASPSIANDGPYKHSSQSMGTIKKFSMEPDVVLYFAQLVNFGADRGGERDELIWVEEDSSKTWMYINNGDGNFGSAVKLDMPDKCKTKGIHWGDVNNDGLDDMICIGPEGDMHVSLNKGGNPPTFEFLGGYFTHPDGYEQRNVRVGDIDGDGRLDYCVAADNGDIYCWRNGGLGARAEYWQDLGKVAPGRGMGDLDGVRLVDINGDGRADWLWMDENGQVTTYINQRGNDKSLKPSWLSAGVTHGGMGTKGRGRQYVFFGRLYDSGRQDYAWVDWGGTSCKLTKCDVELKVWKNTGSGGKYQKGDGAMWGDLTGSGFDDYVWVSPEGKIIVFQNRNVKAGETSGYKSGWIDHGVVLETGMDRKAIHIGDWNGDGKADIIGANKADGALTVWKTSWDGKSFSFSKSNPANTNKCRQGWGIGYRDVGLHLADITGSGFVDYICMEPNGRSDAWLNDHEGEMREVGQIKYSEKKDRANHRFADVNGDGKADFMWIDKFTGDATVWYNQGEVPDRVSGSKFFWLGQGILYLGSARGANIHYPNANGLGRADQVEVQATTAYGYAWYNVCPGGGDDGDETPSAPGLPEYNPGTVDPGDGGTPPDNNEEAAEEFCGRGQSRWTMDLWNQLGMGEWLESRSTMYSNDPNGWPMPEGGSPRDDGVARVFASFNLYDEDNVFDWPSACQDISKQCGFGSTQLNNNGQCRANWQRAFALWSMANFANFIQTWTKEFLGSGLDTSLKLGLMASTFHPDGEEIEMDLGSWNTFVVGLLGVFGSFLSGAAGSATGAAGGLLVMQGSMISAATQPTYDPRFDRYITLSNDFAKLRVNVADAVRDYLYSLIKWQPAAGNVVNGTSIARLLKSGAFVDEDIAHSDNFDREVFYRSSMAPMISEMWNAQKVFILKFPKGKIDFEWKAALGTRKFKWDPCHGSVLYEGLMGDKTYCSGDNYNYVILRWDLLESIMFANYGTSEAALKEFYLTKSDIVKSAQRNQDKSWQFMPRDPAIYQNLWMQMAEDPENMPDRRETLAVNIPICDLYNIDIEWTKEACFEGKDDSKEQFQSCLNSIILNACSRYVWQSYDWPYKV